MRYLAVLVLALGLVAALAAIASRGDTSPAVAGGETPTPYPAESSTITIRFVENGQPIFATFFKPLADLKGDGVTCFFSVPSTVVTASEFSLGWPLNPDPLQVPECSKGPPTRVFFAFDGEWGRVSTEVEWVGDDVTVDLEIPVIATATPSAAASPTPPGSPTAAPVTPTTTPRQLPQTGGATKPNSNTPVLLTLAVIVSVLALAACIGFARTSHKR